MRITNKQLLEAGLVYLAVDDDGDMYAFSVFPRLIGPGVWALPSGSPYDDAHFQFVRKVLPPKDPAEELYELYWKEVKA